MRQNMFFMFMQEFQPTESDTVLDVGVTSDQSYENSNYFEAFYPHKHRITAVGMQNASSNNYLVVQNTTHPRWRSGNRSSAALTFAYRRGAPNQYDQSTSDAP
jgi:hypothetical protein